MIVVVQIGVQDPGPGETTRTYPKNDDDSQLARSLLLLFMKFRSESSVSCLTEVRHISGEDPVGSRVVTVIVTGEGLSKSSDILDTSGNNPQEN